METATVRAQAKQVSQPVQVDLETALRFMSLAKVLEMARKVGK